MYTIEIEKECSCFKKSGMGNNLTFDTREDMYNKARVLECRMNQEFCMTHFFEAVDYGEKIVIHSTLREEDEDDDLPSTQEIKERMSKSVTIGFDASEEPPKNSNNN